MAKKKVTKKPVPASTEVSEDTRTIVTVLLLVCLSPFILIFWPLYLIALLTMWIWTRWKLWVKVLITLLSLLPTLFFLLFLLFSIFIAATVPTTTPATPNLMETPLISPTVTEQPTY